MQKKIIFFVLALVVVGLIWFLSSGDSGTSQEQALVPVLPETDIIPDGNLSVGASEQEAPVPGSSGVEEVEVSSVAGVVAYTNGGFNPRIIEVRMGESVTWINESSRNMWVASAIHPTHKVYDGTSLRKHCNDAGVTPFDACESMSSGAEWSFNFDQLGEWGYHDHVNAFRTGKVVVSE